MDTTAMAEVGCALFSALGAVFAYLWRRFEAQRDKTIQDHGKAIDDLEKSLSDLDKHHGDALAAYKLHVAETYPTMNVLTKSIDTIGEALSEVLDIIGFKPS